MSVCADLPVGARGPQNAGGGIHWFKAGDETMTSLTETGFLFTVNVAPNGTSIGPLMECPDGNCSGSLRVFHTR